MGWWEGTDEIDTPYIEGFNLHHRLLGHLVPLGDPSCTLTLITSFHIFNTVLEDGGPKESA
ncbi:hypothetical protein A2U01_0081034, partial [Trifolium medium]|nr:hypothetical protein [Trifolium medium]